MRKLVTYTVKFKCSIIIEKGEDEQDAISNIDIPEGGTHDSVYCKNSFKIIEVQSIGPGRPGYAPLVDALKAIAQDEGNGDNFKWAQMTARNALSEFENE